MVRHHQQMTYLWWPLTLIMGAIWLGRQGTWFNSATSSEIANGTTTNHVHGS